MKQFAAVALLWLIPLAGCGKVGDPLPPFVRIPGNIKDLAARQEGYNLVLSWTNPSRYVDGSFATDLQEARVVRNGVLVATLRVTGAGQMQSHSIETRDAVGIRQVFDVRIATTRGRISEPSNGAFIQPVEVPGPVRNLRAAVDQRRIRLEWDPPEENADLAQVYLAHRTDRAVGQFVGALQYDDANFERGQTYEYDVTASRREPAFIPGTGTRTIRVNAVDRTPPKPPMGLQVNPSGNGALLTWAANVETDLAGYRIFRSDRPAGGFGPLEEGLHTTNGFFDPNYRPDAYYAVSAVDESGNESAMSVLPH